MSERRKKIVSFEFPELPDDVMDNIRYAAGVAAGLEQAAKVCDEIQRASLEPEAWKCAADIRALIGQARGTANAGYVSYIDESV